jgi:LacI family transcriptional regulator
MPTIRDVAALAGVSATTVSHVLNGTRRVEPATVDRVQAAIEQLNYRPNALAASMRGGSTRTVGIVVPDIANPFFADLGRAVEDATFERGYSAFLCNSDGDEAKEALYLDTLLRRQVDGVLLVSAGGSADQLRGILDNGPPVVIVDRELEGLAASQVMVDNQLGGRLAAEYLTDLGHQHIGVIAGPPSVRPSARRLDGLREALAEVGVEIPPERVVRSDYRSAGGKAAITELLTRDARITALFAENDLMAIGAMGAAQAAGLRVPEDLTIIGFDDIRFSEMVTPALTTVAQPVTEIATTAIELLFERLLDASAPPRQVVLPVSLIVRASCGPPRTAA